MTYAFARSHRFASLGARLGLGLLLTACPGADDGPPEQGGTASADSGSGTTAVATDAADSSDGADSTGGGPPLDDDAVSLLGRLPGLWIAPVTSTTSVGNFPLMAMDMRPADDRTIFSRVDLDADNNLRFAFVVETIDGAPTLVFRNGGYFLGILRDTRAALVEHETGSDAWRFCAIAGGCGYVDVDVYFDGPDVLVVSADVMGRPHMHWEGVLTEERPTDGDFPYDPSPGAGDEPFPELPTLRATLSWTQPLAEPTEAWLVLTTTDCALVPGSCAPSRFLRGIAPAGATSVELVFDQIHAGDYVANAILDRNGNLGASLLPDAGDTVSLPNQDLTIAAAGESTVSVALLVDL